jgi:hypothetical protein
VALAAASAALMGGEAFCELIGSGNAERSPAVTIDVSSAAVPRTIRNLNLRNCA